MRKNLLFTVALLLGSGEAFAQHIRRNYVILTFEEPFKLSPHGKDTYYWIIPADSLSKKSLAVLLMSGYSKDVMDNCCLDKPVNPFVSTGGASYSFSPKYLLGLDSLQRTIFSNHKEIQRIERQWSSGQREKLVVYATPVIGEFCSSYYDFSYNPGYRGRIYIPKVGFSFDQVFWQNQSKNYFFNQDFSKIDFSAFQNIGRKP